MTDSAAARDHGKQDTADKTFGAWATQPGPTAPKRVRSAYVCFWAKQEARDRLDAMAAERNVNRSEMARIIFGAGIAALGAPR